MKKSLATIPDNDGIWTVSNPKLDEARKEGRLLERITAEQIKAYCASHPLALAAEDDTGHFCDILKEALLNQFYKLVIPKSKHSELHVKHSDVAVKIDGVSHDFSIESSVTTDEMRSYITDVRMVRLADQRQRGIESPAEQLRCHLFMAVDGNGGVGLTEKWSLEIDPTGQYPESVMQTLPGGPLLALLDSPLARHPAMASLTIDTVDNPSFGQGDALTFMITGKLKRPL